LGRALQWKKSGVQQVRDLTKEPRINHFFAKAGNGHYVSGADESARKKAKKFLLH